jgi:biotin carboxyl carrier protein
VSDDPTGLGPASDDAGTAAGLDALTDEILPALIARLRASRLAEIEVASDGWRVRLRRDGTATRRSAAPGHSAAGTAATEPAALDGSVARSPAVGYFKPTQILALGHSVQSGDSLGSVDVLGISHDVPAPTGGFIARVLAEAGQAVEYGQVLAEIDPLGADLEAEAGDERAVVD